ncbi:MAG: hypothetical protein NTW67_05655 [Candidatus Woesearchaeota archaeon]|nr:hypothetical protein [Candidatus Woesearchaeota archaeon]
MNYAQKIATTVVLTGTAVYALLAGGCASSEHRTAGKQGRAYNHSGKMEKVECIENVLQAYNKDSAINPSANPAEDEVLGTFAQKERIAKLRPVLAESPELTTRLIIAERTAESYLANLADSKDQVKGYIVLITQRKSPGASIRVYGLIENDHMPLDGTLAKHVTELGLDRDGQLKKSPSAVGERFGYKPDTDLSEKIGEIRAATAHVDKTKWNAVAQFIPASGLKTQSGDSISKAEYELMLKEGEVVDVRVIHLANAKQAAKKAEKKEESKAEPSTSEF